MIIRQQILQTRKHLSQDFQSFAALKVMDQMLTLVEYQNAQNIALYLAIKGELNTLPILKKSWELNKKCYLPRINIDNKMLSFILYERHNALIKNEYGLFEPLRNDKNRIEMTAIDLVITPLVAFDIAGNRLGMGGGFYDRNFSFKKNNKKHKPYLFGVAYEFQKIQSITTNPWDITLDCVITEEQIYSFNESIKS